MMKKISCLSSDHHQDKKKKNSVLKKNRKIAEKKIPRQIFVDKIFRCLLKSTKQKYVLRPQKNF
jgi:hypothetical protein